MADQEQALAQLADEAKSLRRDNEAQPQLNQGDKTEQEMLFKALSMAKGRIVWALSA